MKNLYVRALAALRANSAAPCTCAQTPTPSPGPSAAPSSHQRDAATGTKAPESAASNGSAPGDVSSPD
jgi:hypothetical protein